MKIYLTILSILFITATYGQTFNVKGTVQDECGNPIAYATILCKKSRNGTYTGPDGKYSLTIDPVIDDTLVCSHTNFLLKEEKIGSNNIIVFELNKKMPEQYSVLIPVNITDNKTNQDLKIHQDLSGRFINVEMAAGYPGGQKSFAKELQKKLNSIDSTKIRSIEGVVKIRLTITIDGNVKNVILMRGLNTFHDETIIQAIMKMPRWKPALQNGRNVEDYKEILISFVQPKQ